MLRILPQKDFPITRNLDDPLDTNTYFIRAFIYNAAVDSNGMDADSFDQRVMRAVRRGMTGL